MAKRRRKKRRSFTRDRYSQRDIPNYLLRVLVLRGRYPRKKRNFLQDDRREWRPYTFDDYKKIDGRPVSFTLTATGRRKTVRRDPTRTRIRFADPKKTMVCVRRKERRRTLFATGGAGSGRRVNPIRRRNEASNISCKRR